METEGTPPAVGVEAAARSGLLGLGLYRSPRRRVIGGVAGGIGERLGVDPVVIRVAFALLSLCFFAGVVLYALLWATLPDDEGEMTITEPGVRRAASVALVVLGLMTLLRSAGLWLGDLVASSLTLVALGVGVLWVSTGKGDRERWSRSIVDRVPEGRVEAVDDDAIDKLRLLAGATLLIGGVATFIARTDLFTAAPTVVLAIATTTAGLGLIFGPWGWRMLTQLSEERRERIRSQERAEMAAHLHDSVLQTLALIQRTDQPKEVVALARNQERELRAWLNGTLPRTTETLAGAIEQAAAAVELQLSVPIEVVTVGDAPLDERLLGMVEASREAMFNAAKHSKAERISVYMEVEREQVYVFVRDEGCGFDLAAVAPDRRGIAESIQGRMDRLGGTAAIVSEPGSGTEVQLTMSASR
jgi:signal transduction histidine kinase